MTQNTEVQRFQYDLFPHRLIMAIVMLLALAYVAIGYRFDGQLQQHLPESQRIIIRTVFYAIAIIIFPLTRLIRHIMVRLNQTMPGGRPASKRYLTTVVVSMAMIQNIGLFGFVVFMLGDGFNSLYIFIFMDLLGLFLYRPKLAEYLSIVDALSENSE